MPNTSNPRLEHVVDLPLGAVLTAEDGETYIFVGTSRSSVGQTYHFMPRIGAYGQLVPLIWNCSLLQGALKKFPGMTAYLTKPQQQPANLA
jgi:hypothetical protein